MSEFPVYNIANYQAKEQDIYLNKTPIKEKIELKLEKLPRDLVAIAENVARISGTWNPVEIYTADNDTYDAEMIKVFDAYDKGEEYNPQFTYGHANKLNLETYRTSLENQMHRLRKFGTKKKHFWQKHDKKGGKLTLDRGTRLFRTALYFKIKDDLATCDLVEGIKNKDEDTISRALKQKYPGTDQSLYDAAEAEYVRLLHTGDEKADDAEPSDKGLATPAEIKWLKNKKLTAIEVAEAFKWALKEYGIYRTSTTGRGFFVKVSKDATGIDVRSKSTNGPTVFVPDDRTMSAYKLLTLMAHEIEGHARQDVNGEEQFFLGGGRLKIDNEELYEGLGLRYEFDIEKKLFGVENAAPSPHYTFAARMAEEGSSFFDIFKDQMERRMRIQLKKPTGEELPPISEFKPEKLKEIKDAAWKCTYRIMRGHIDTTNKSKFAMSKDLGYLRGYQMDKQLRENDLGFINEEGIIAQGGLAMLAELKLSDDKLPLPFQDVTTKYFKEVLRPQILYPIEFGKIEELQKAA